MFTIKWTNSFSVAYQNISKYPCYWQGNKDIRMQLFTFSKCIQTMNNWCNNKSENEKYFNRCRINSESCIWKHLQKSVSVNCIWSNPQTSKSNLTLSLISHLHSVVRIRLTITNLDSLRNFPTKKPDFFSYFCFSMFLGDDSAKLFVKTLIRH